MSVNKQRSAEEIAENRRIALQRLNQKQQAKSARLLELPPEQQIFIAQQSTSSPALTNEQKSKIEQNRLAAIERAKANGKSPPPPGKSIAPSKLAVADARPNPYTHPPVVAKQPLALRLKNPESSTTKNAVASTSSSMVQKKIDNNTLLTISFELVSEDRFSVKTNKYDENVISELKTVKSKVYSK